MLGMLARPLAITFSSGDSAATNATFPGANLLNNDYGRVARTTSGNVGTYNFVFDAGSAVTADAMAVLWHNLRSTDNIRVQGATSVANLTAGVGYDSGYLSAWTGTSKRDTPVAGKFLVSFATPQTYRYWRFVVQVVGTNLAAPIQISRAALMKSTIFQIGPQRADLGAVDLNQKIELETGESRTTEDVHLIRPTCTLDIRYAKESEMSDFFGQYTLSMGVSKVMFICADLTAANLQDQIVFGRPEKIINLQSDTYDVWQLQAAVRSLGP
jgi:hypothetical protein